MSLTNSNLDVVGTITGSRLISDVSTGTAPLTVTSTTVVANLNVDQVDGLDASQFLRSDASDTTTGDITISKTSPKLILNDTNTTTGSYPAIQFDTNNNQGVLLEHNELDGELPVAGYGLILKESPNNGQFPSTGTLTFTVLGQIYTGSATTSSTSRVLTTADEGSGNGLDADTLDGQEGSYYTDASNINAGTLAIARGGTNGSASPTSGAIAYGTGTAYAFSAAGSSNQVLLSGGTGSPTWTNQSNLSVGSATTTTNIPNLTGDVTSNGTVTSIAPGVIVNADINASAAIVDTKLATISTANKVSISALNIDGGTATTTLSAADLLIVDDGANGTNRKITAADAKTYFAAGAVGSGGTWSSNNVGVHTTKIVGVNTSTIAGAANSEGALQVYGNVTILDGALLTDQNIDTNVYIPSGKNGLMIGPTTVGIGVTIDVAPGSTLVVV